MPRRLPRPPRPGAVLLCCTLAACSAPAPQPGHLFTPGPARAATAPPAPTRLAPRPAPAPAPAATTAPAATSTARPAAATAPSPALAAASRTPPTPGDNITPEQRRQLAAIPLPQLPTLVAPPGDAGTVAAPAAPAAAPPAAAAGPGEVRSYGAELARASDRIGLGEAQLARIREAQALASSGQESAALAALIRLNQDLDSGSTVYVVQHGEALRQIAARSEVYGNANLWPLIQDANRDTLSDPRRLTIGQRLRVPSFPSAAEAAEAIERARAAGREPAP